jgi:hypothetical protein
MSDKSVQSVPVRFSELQDAFMFVSGGDQIEAAAYICPTSGKIYWVGDSVPDDEAVPDDLDDCVEVPHKRDLDLGSRLVFAFAEQAMPDDYDTIRDIFRKKGAYARLKDFLRREGMLEKWYAFEEEATERALRAWCEENDIALADA